MFGRGSREKQVGALQPPGSTLGAVTKFALSGLLALALVGVAAFLVMRGIGTNQATDDAKRITRVVAQGVVEPHVDAGVIAGRRASVEKLDSVVRKRVLGPDIVRVKIWTPSGRIVYSDKPRLVGQRYELGSDEVAAIQGGGVAADVSDLDQAENRFERPFGKLLEVYLGIESTNGKPLLFETYQRFSSIASSGSDIWLAFAPALLGALILLELVHVPLASSMAKRLRRGHREREELLQRAFESSELERRRIAADLHDGVVQQLAGTSFSLAAAAERLEGANGGAATALREGSVQTRQSVRELRGLLAEIYPASLREAGLEQALWDLLAPVEGRGIATDVEIEPDLDLPPDVQALFFRVAQEGVRNAVRHGDPATITVAAGESAGTAWMTVSDDGRGFDPGAAAGDGEEHFGLRLMRDLARDAGAELAIESRPGGGTVVRVEAASA
jgi:two-component system, NarL family, sensor kinase